MDPTEITDQTLTTTTTNSTMATTMATTMTATEEIPKKVQIVGQSPQQQAIGAMTGSEKTEESPHYSAVNEQTTNINTVTAPAPRVNSWAALTGNALAKPSPSRRQLRTLDRVSGARGKGKQGAAKTQLAMRDMIGQAIRNKGTLWVSYNGHQKPFLPRCIEPKKWDNRQQGNNRQPGPNQKQSFFCHSAQVQEQ